ncbi:MAG TPA: pilus assembly protein TadG-related protein [Beijerinckiaceae bacterium]|jgi:Flp pilus assembly protein TadG
MLRFWRDVRGTTAVLFGLAMLPLLGLTGVAVDYSRATNLHGFLQTASDAAAIGAAAAEDPEGSNRALGGARSVIATHTGARALQNVNVLGKWLTAVDYEVTIQGRMDATIMQAVPFLPKTMDLKVVSVARVTQPLMTAAAPRISQLDPEAGDYNQLSVYCFDASKKDRANNGNGNSGNGNGNGNGNSRNGNNGNGNGNSGNSNGQANSGSDEKGRSQMTPIADNGGTTYTFRMPTCGEGETLSYKLKNVRGARTRPSMWNDSTVEQYEYFTDTTVVGAVQKQNTGVDILETAICDTFESCKPISRGGVLPEGRERTPQQTEKACEPGKFLYMGWEDRPPGRGWTDRDYDDIRIVMECPRFERSGTKQVRLIK